MRKEDWPQEVSRQWQLGNFRPSRAERQARTRTDFRKSRPGMSPLHLTNIRQLPCSVCEERGGIQAHHIKHGGARSERGVFLKATDRWAVSLCLAHHADVERYGSRREMEWWNGWAMDGEALALGLWNARGDPIRMDFVLREHKKQAVRQLSARRQLIVDLRTGEWRREP